MHCVRRSITPQGTSSRAPRRLLRGLNGMQLTRRISRSIRQIIKASSRRDVQSRYSTCLLILVVRLVRIATTSFHQDINILSTRLERHARATDQTAVATELVAAAEFRKDIERRQAEDLKIQCEQWLKPSNVNFIHQLRVGARLDGTCEWIMTHAGFRRWRDPAIPVSRNRLLTISGPPSQGKLVLASSIVVALEKDTQPTLFFAFSSSDRSRQRIENMLRTLVWQLVHKCASKEATNAVHQLRTRTADQPTASELWDVVQAISSLMKRPIFWVLDGLDEYSDFDASVLTRISISLRPAQIYAYYLLVAPMFFNPIPWPVAILK